MEYNLNLGEMTLIDIGAVLVAVIAAAISGAVSTMITIRVGLARVEERIALSNKAAEERLEETDARMAEGFHTFQKVGDGLRDAVTQLTSTVAQHAVHVNGLGDFAQRLRMLEQDVAVLKSR